MSLFKDIELGAKVKSRKQVHSGAFEKVEYALPNRQIVGIEALSTMQGCTLVFDVETYHNYFICNFKVFKQPIYFSLNLRDHEYKEKLYYLLTNFLLIGFNSNDFDLPILFQSFKQCSEERLAFIADDMINNNNREYKAEYHDGYLKPNTIDIMPVAPLSASLKIYSGRLHAKRMQDLPIKPGSTLSDSEKVVVRDYCFNDCDNTELLVCELNDQIALRYSLSNKYGIDLRSKSDAQIAESILSAEISKIKKARLQKPKITPNYTIHYKAPSFLKFQTKQLQDLKSHIESIAFPLTDNGSPYVPDKYKIEKDSNKIRIAEIGNSAYTIALGGLHSNEKSKVVIPKKGYKLIDADVASYYPNIILNTGLFPLHLGADFLRVYANIVSDRIAAKRRNDNVTADSLKIVANGSFGKLGSQHSILYSPDLMLQVTLGGQLFLLMLIDQLELAGISVVSANTDGIVSLVADDKQAEYDSIMKNWQSNTGFELDFAEYKALYSKDVNNYIAVKLDGKCKLKGEYSNHWNGDKKSAIFRFHKNPENLICVEALEKFLTKGMQVEQTVKECKDITKFITVRHVKGGAVKNDVYLGGAIRWYYAKGVTGSIVYSESGNCVPLTEGAKPLMELPDDLPTDIDYDRYILLCYSMLADLGYYSTTERLKL